jgi:gliding motility-associated-like protein
MTLIAPLSGVGIQWTTIGGQIVGSATSNQISFDGPGTYIVEVTHVLSACKDRDTIVVSQITEGPEGIQTQVTPANCEDVSDGTISFGTIQGGTPPYSIFVDGVEINGTSLTGLESGSYDIEIEDINGCLFDTTINILTGEEVMVDLEAQVTIVVGQDHVLIAGVNIPAAEIGDVQWTPGQFLSCDTCLTTEAMPEVSTTYTIVVTDIYGCTGQAVVAIRVIDDNQVFIPNVITPSNGDQINDYFTVFTNIDDARILTMRIFNRWGAVIFEKSDFLPNDPSLGWDGTFKGEALNPAVFVYMIELITPDGRIEVFKGDVTIVR